MKQTVRTFVAVEISPEVRRRAEELIERLRPASADVKWVAPHNLHITLKFLGDVALRETAALCKAIARAAAEVAPFGLEFRGAGAFPNAARPRTIWLGTSGGSDGGSDEDGDDDGMRALHKQVETRLGKLGFRKDARRFQAHLTIGRVRRGGPGLAELGQLIRQQADFQAGRMTVSEVVVFSSRLDPSGPTYEPLGRAGLGGLL